MYIVVYSYSYRNNHSKDYCSAIFNLNWETSDEIPKDLSGKKVVLTGEWVTRCR